jgi:hypothetical protein
MYGPCTERVLITIAKLFLISLHEGHNAMCLQVVLGNGCCVLQMVGDGCDDDAKYSAHARIRTRCSSKRRVTAGRY